VLLEQAAEFQQGGGVRHAFASQVDAHEAAQCRAVEQRVFAGLVCEVEPVLHEVHAQHALQPDGRASVAGLGVVRLDDFAQGLPGHDLLHGGQEGVMPGGPAVLLEAVQLTGRHGEGWLFHLHCPLCLRCETSRKDRARLGLIQRCLNAPQSLPIRCVITVLKVTHGTATLLALHSADNHIGTHTLAIVAIRAIQPG
jgi:hypothetical protein